MNEMQDKAGTSKSNKSIGESGEYYDAIAVGYNELHGEEQRAKYQLIADRLNLPAGALVLDVGAGTGLGFAIIPSIGIDPSAALLAQHPHPQSVVGIAEEIPFPDKSFDAVISVTALHHANPVRALAEMRRVSRGPIAISLLKKSAHTNVIIAEAARTLSPLTILEQTHDRVIIFNPEQPNKPIAK